jgi:carnitine O-acetyltransferase
MNRQLKKIVERSQHYHEEEEERLALGLLTTEHRDIWAAARADLLKNPSNQDPLETLESAAFLLCLDDTSPLSLEDVSHF